MKTAVQFTDEMAAELIRLVKAEMRLVEFSIKQDHSPESRERIKQRGDMLGRILSLLR